MPRFHVKDTFAIADQGLFILAGLVIEGEVSGGMLVRLPFNATTMITQEIDHIQHLQRPDGDVVCLCIRCGTAPEVALWEALKIKERIVEVIKAA